MVAPVRSPPDEPSELHSEGGQEETLGATVNFKTRGKFGCKTKPKRLRAKKRWSLHPSRPYVLFHALMPRVMERLEAGSFTICASGTA